MRQLFILPSALLGILALMAVASAQADEPESKLQYDFVQVNSYRINPGDEIAGRGRGVDGNIPWGRRLPYYTLIRFIDPDNDYEKRRDHEDKTAQYSFETGIGRHQRITDRLNWTAAVLFHYRENGVEPDDEPDAGDAYDDTGLGLQFGLRHLPIDQLEWGLELAAIELDNVELHRSANLQWHANSVVGIGVKLLQREHDQLQSIYLRLSF